MLIAAPEPVDPQGALGLAYRLSPQMREMPQATSTPRLRQL